MKTIRENFENLPSLVAELHAQPVRRSLDEGGFAESAKLEQAIKANLRGLGFK